MIIVLCNFHPESDDNKHPTMDDNNTNHPKLDDFISDEIIIHFWMILYGNFHPFLDQEHTSIIT